MIIDLGDATLNVFLRVKGLQRLSLRFHVGTPRDTSEEDRVVKGPPYASTPERVDFGTANAAAVGTLGAANVHVVATLADGVTTFSGDLQIVVVAGLAERITIVAGTPTEVTPD